MWGRAFWKSAAERAVKTAAQSALAILAADGVELLTADWPAIGGTVALATVLSVLTSIASAGIGDPGTPSLVSTGRHARPE